MTNWEYRVEELPSPAADEERRLNELAGEGWELVSIEHGRARLRRARRETVQRPPRGERATPESDLPPAEILHRGKRSGAR